MGKGFYEFFDSYLNNSYLEDRRPGEGLGKAEAIISKDAAATQFSEAKRMLGDSCGLEMFLFLSDLITERWYFLLIHPGY